MNEKTDAKISFTTGKFQRRLQQNTFESISDNQIFISDTVVPHSEFWHSARNHKTHELATFAQLCRELATCNKTWVERGELY